MLQKRNLHSGGIPMQSPTLRSHEMTLLSPASLALRLSKMEAAVQAVEVAAEELDVVEVVVLVVEGTHAG